MGVVCQYFCPQPSPQQIEIPLNPIQRQFRIGLADFRIDGKIGQGGFGSVFLAQLKANIENGITKKFAIKMVSKKKLEQKNITTNAFQEKLIALYKHQFIVSLQMCFQDKYYIYYVLEYACGGDTYSLIKKDSPKSQKFKALGEKGVRFVAACTIIGLQFLHANDYIYRDLKPQNVLIFQDGYVKLSDFGLAKKVVEGQKNKSIIGTKIYYAPQMILKSGYHKPIDFWALGVYLYELSNYNPPFSIKQIMSGKQFENICKLAENERVWLNNQTSPELKDLINKLLKFDPSTRLGANGWSQVKEHPFFQNFDWEKLVKLEMQSPLSKIVAEYPATINQNQQQLTIHDTQIFRIEGWSYYGDYAPPRRP